ncbi:MAG: hypothetical protein ACLRY5_16255 [Zhenhengia sp.]
MNSGSFSTSKPQDNTYTQSGNTYRPNPFFTGGFFNSWYYGMPAIRHGSPAVLITFIIIIAIFVAYWWWRRHL